MNFLLFIVVLSVVLAQSVSLNFGVKNKSIGRFKRQLWRETVDLTEPSRLAYSRNQQALERLQLARRLGYGQDYDSLRGGYGSQSGLDPRYFGSQPYSGLGRETQSDPFGSSRPHQLSTEQILSRQASLANAGSIPEDQRNFGSSAGSLGLDGDTHRPATGRDTLELAREIADLKAEVARLRSGLADTTGMRGAATGSLDVGINPESYGTGRNREAELLARLRAEQLDKPNLSGLTARGYPEPLLTANPTIVNRMF